MTRTNAFTLLCIAIRAVIVWVAANSLVGVPSLLFAIRRGEMPLGSEGTSLAIMATVLGLLALAWLFADKLARLALSSPNEQVFESDLEPRVWLGLATAATWLIIAFFFRYSSLASLVAAAFAPVYYLLVDGVVWYAEGTIAGSIIVMAMLLAWRHKENIQRLIEGKESRLGSKKAKPNAEGAGKSPK